jgi:hypothetical protein
MDQDNSEKTPAEKEPLTIAESFTRPWNAGGQSNPPTWEDVKRGDVDPASPFYIPPENSMRIWPGYYIQQRNFEQAVDYLRRCSSLARWLTTRGEVQRSISELISPNEIAFELRIFEALVYFCNFTPNEWTALANRTGFSVKELDEMWQLLAVLQHNRWGPYPNGKTVIDPGIIGIERVAN